MLYRSYDVWVIFVLREPCNSGNRTNYHMVNGEWAHRRACGSIPPGMVADHLCGNRGCSTPSHLDVTTMVENSRRGNRGVTRTILRDAMRAGSCRTSLGGSV